MMKQEPFTEVRIRIMWKTPDNALKPEILLVEDNKEILDFICHEISADYLVRKASNGTGSNGNS